MVSEQPIHLAKLIQLLGQLSELSTRSEQLAAIERALVEAELDPNPLPFLDLASGFELLAEVETRRRVWLETDLELGKFFTESGRSPR